MARGGNDKRHWLRIACERGCMCGVCIVVFASAALNSCELEQYSVSVDQCDNIAGVQTDFHEVTADGTATGNVIIDGKCHIIADLPDDEPKPLEGSND
jgi:hypothetical protein